MQYLTSCPICNSQTIASFITTTAQMHASKELFNFDQCANCQLVFLNPRVEIQDLKNYYTAHYLPYRGSKAWGRYEKIVEVSEQKLNKKRLKTIKEAHSLSEKSLILDVGCGNPSFLKLCHEKLKCKTLGIDFSDEGWKDQPSDFKDLNLQVAEIKDLPTNLEPDVITMWHYLEHDYTPELNLKHLRTIAQPTTTLVIEIPNFDSESRKKYGKNWAGWHTPRHLSLFSPHNIEQLLNKSGWQVSSIFTHGSMDSYLLYWLSEMEEKQIRWDKSMESEFANFIFGMLKFLPKKWNEKKVSLGIMTVIAQPL